MKSVSIVTSTAEPAFATDAKGTIVAWNRAAEQLLGYEASKVIGKRCHQVLCGTDVFGNRFCDANCPLSNMARRREPVRHFQLDVRNAKSEVFRAGVSVIVLPEQSRSKFSIIHILKPLEKETESLPERPTAVQQSGLPSRESRLARLSRREVDVLRLMADGMSTRKIANELAITVPTVRNHIQNALRRLKVHNRLEAITLAQRMGLI